MDGKRAAVALAAIVVAAAASLTGCAIGGSEVEAFDRPQEPSDELPDPLVESGLPLDLDTTRLMWEDDEIRLYAAKGLESRQICFVPVPADEEKASAGCGDSLPITIDVQDAGKYALGESPPSEQDDWTRLAEDVWRADEEGRGPAFCRCGLRPYSRSSQIVLSWVYWS